MNIGHKILIEDVGKNSDGVSLSRLVLQMFVDGELVATKSLGVADSEMVKDVIAGRMMYKNLSKDIG
jgi:hypothetical protein